MRISSWILKVVSSRLQLSTSIPKDKWQERFKTDGVKAGEIPGDSQGKPAILVQSAMYPFYTQGEFVVISFEKEASEVFKDLDDLDLEKGEDPSYKDSEWEVVGNPFAHKCSWVNEIRPEEIKEIYDARTEITEDDTIVWKGDKKLYNLKDMGY